MHTTPVYSCLKKIPQRDPRSVNPALLMPRKCVDSADNFCYICCEVTFTRQRKAITATVKKGISFVFRMQDRRPRQILVPAHMLQ